MHMSSNYQKIYYIQGEIFREKTNKKALAFAKHYAKEHGYDEKDIYELSNNAEIVYLTQLLEKQEKGEVEAIFTSKRIAVLSGFENYDNEDIPELAFEISCIYREKGGGHRHYVKVVNSVYELTRELINSKILFDYVFKDTASLEIYYPDEDNKLKKWKLTDKDIFIKEAKERHKKKLAQMRAIRDRQKYDRLLKLRSEGKITERQSQELYRLEKVFRG